MGQVQCITLSVHMLKNVTECMCSKILGNSHRKRHSVHNFEPCNSLQLPVSTIVFIPTQTNEMCYQSSVMLKISIIYLSTDQFSPGLLCSIVAAVINGQFKKIFSREVMLCHKIESENGHSIIDLTGVIVNELGHGGSRGRKRGWNVRKRLSNLTLDLVLRRDLAPNRKWLHVCPVSPLI